jgi:hypothetical protein
MAYLQEMSGTAAGLDFHRHNISVGLYLMYADLMVK